jgi:hypothetical protein
MKMRISRTTKRRYNRAIAMMKEGKHIKQASLAHGISTTMILMIMRIENPELTGSLLND